MIYVLLVLLILVSILLIMLVLMQSGEGGLSSAFGGTGYQLTSLFGAHTPSILIKATTTLATIFGILTILINIIALFHSKQTYKSKLQEYVETQKITQVNIYNKENSKAAPANTIPIKKATSQENKEANTIPIKQTTSDTNK